MNAQAINKLVDKGVAVKNVYNNINIHLSLASKGTHCSVIYVKCIMNLYIKYAAVLLISWVCCACWINASFSCLFF